MKKLFLTCALLLPFTLAAQTYNGDEKEIQQILKNIESFSEYVMSGDYEGIARAYTRDAKIMVTNRDIIEGRDKIKEYWTPGGSSKTIYHKIHPVEISVTGNTAYDYGRYQGTTRTGSGEKVDWQGKYVIIWKKVGGEWKIYVDIWNRTE